jgi:glycosyltransferase involved in cell wall biosynthesis
MTKKKVLISQQSTIPHYRVDFFNAIQANKPDGWDFDVAFDLSELKRKRFFKESLNTDDFHFSILPTHTYGINLRGRFIHFQSFLADVKKYDLVIVGSGMSNLSYMLCRLFMRRGARYAIWGQGRNNFSQRTSPLKRGAEYLRTSIAQSCDGFFAYTKGIKDYLVSRKVDADKIYVLENSIDIDHQRQLYHQHQPDRDRIKRDLHLEGKRVLLFVGRCTKQKKVDFLLDALQHLAQTSSQYHLLMVGSGFETHQARQTSHVTFTGPVTQSAALAQLYVASDVFAFPGCVGLGPIQAFCYDLPIVTNESDIHSSEYEHLTTDNAIRLPQDTTPKAYAQAIHALFEDAARLTALKQSTWQSIRHLTIDNMSGNFIAGVNDLLGMA